MIAYFSFSVFPAHFILIVNMLYAEPCFWTGGPFSHLCLMFSFIWKLSQKVIWVVFAMDYFSLFIYPILSSIQRCDCWKITEQSSVWRWQMLHVQQLNVLSQLWVKKSLNRPKSTVINGDFKTIVFVVVVLWDADVLVLLQVKEVAEVPVSWWTKCFTGQIKH